MAEGWNGGWEGRRRGLEESGEGMGMGGEWGGEGSGEGMGIHGREKASIGKADTTTPPGAIKCEFTEHLHVVQIREVCP